MATQVLPRYSKMDRARTYAMTADAKRYLVWLWQSWNQLDLENATELFQPICGHCALPMRQKTLAARREEPVHLILFAHWQNCLPTEPASKARISWPNENLDCTLQSISCGCEGKAIKRLHGGIVLNHSAFRKRNHGSVCPASVAPTILAQSKIGDAPVKIKS